MQSVVKIPTEKIERYLSSFVIRTTCISPSGSSLAISSQMWPLRDSKLQN